jgi:hypothetical protein
MRLLSFTLILLSSGKAPSHSPWVLLCLALPTDLRIQDLSPRQLAEQRQSPLNPMKMPLPVPAQLLLAMSFWLQMSRRPLVSMVFK